MIELGYFFTPLPQDDYVFFTDNIKYQYEEECEDTKMLTLYNRWSKFLPKKYWHFLDNKTEVKEDNDRLLEFINQEPKIKTLHWTAALLERVEKEDLKIVQKRIVDWLKLYGKGFPSPIVLLMYILIWASTAKQKTTSYVYNMLKEVNFPFHDRFLKLVTDTLENEYQYCVCCEEFITNDEFLNPSILVCTGCIEKELKEDELGPCAQFLRYLCSEDVYGIENINISVLEGYFKDNVPEDE